MGFISPLVFAVRIIFTCIYYLLLLCHSLQKNPSVSYLCNESQVIFSLISHDSLSSHIAAFCIIICHVCVIQLSFTLCLWLSFLSWYQSRRSYRPHPYSHSLIMRRRSSP